MTLRRTKIVATLGPATSSPESIEAIIKAGVNVVRLNFSHGSADEHIARAKRVREIGHQLGRFIGVLVDLQGPKLRIARFKNEKVSLSLGQTFVFDTQLPADKGTESRVGVDYKSLIDDVKKGDILLLDDGRMEMEVTDLTDHEIICKTRMAGILSNNKGINLKGGGLSAKALTDKDKADINTAALLQADYVAVSFPRSAEDMHEARALLEQAGCDAGLMAKIERAEVVKDEQILDDIILASDAVMVARGDLAVEIGDAELVAVQKHIIQRARTLNRIVVTATQMMESMIDNPIPTRAEVSDVANAVFDNTDAVMLSAESAVGKFPVETIEAMARICVGAEKHPLTTQSHHRILESCETIDETIAMSAMYAANHLIGTTAIICLTESGATPRLMSRIRSPLPIFACSRDTRTQARVSLYRNVHALALDLEEDNFSANAIFQLMDKGMIKKGDKVIVTQGLATHNHEPGSTNSLQIITI